MIMSNRNSFFSQCNKFQAYTYVDCLFFIFQIYILNWYNHSLIFLVMIDYFVFIAILML
jgi:hypothetical protein